ncbi:hypothetical protein R5R35_013139 [Gryllus longicercus]|uniref:Uncharacterized protein n=1 Tax=Gryllus longicercus TaxID=2509291 RepID=A0AAN9WVS3_9ORTH
MRQDTLNKSGSVAGSSLLPELPANVSELVGSATRCVLRLLEDSEGLTPLRGRASLGAGSGGRSKAQLRRTSSGAGGDAGRLGAQLAHHRSLDDMQWEASGSAVATPRSVRTLSDAALSPSAALAHSHSYSRSDGQLALAGTDTATAAATVASTGPSTAATFSADSSGAAAADTASDPAADTSASMDVGASFVAPPRRQSTTLEDYLAFKKPLCDPVEISIESTESLPSINLPVDQDKVNTQTGPKTNQENCAPLPPHKAKEVLKKAEGAIQNMSEVMEMLKKWMISEEGPSTEVPSAKARTLKAKPTRMPTFRASVPATKPTTRRLAAAGAAGHAKQQAPPTRSPSASSVGSAGSRGNSASASSARGASGSRTQQGTHKTSKPNAGSGTHKTSKPNAGSGPSKPLAKSAVAALRRRSLEDAGAATAPQPGTPRAPRTPMLRRPRAAACSSPYVATAPSFGLAARSPRSSPTSALGQTPSPNPSPRPSPRARVPPPKPKRTSAD